LKEYLDLARRAGPNLYIVGVRQQGQNIETETHFMRTKGIGTQSRAAMPNTVDAHRGFRALYILAVNSCPEKGVSERRS